LLHRALRDEVLYMYGDYGLGLIASSLKINYLSAATSTAIVRVARAHYRILWAALSWITRVPGEKRGEGIQCVIRVVRVCGTIRKAEEEVVRRAREDILRVRRESAEGSAGILGRVIEEKLGSEKERAGDGEDGGDEMDIEDGEEDEDEDEEDGEDG
ncbi:MAG: hypothetical protein Q9164_005126, partial [Protoblastenia rupestris]